MSETIDVSRVLKQQTMPEKGRFAAVLEETPIAFTCKDSGQDASEDQSPTLRSMNHDDSHANAGGQVAVAFKPSHYTRGKDGAPSETYPPLSADADKDDQDPVVMVEAFGENTRDEVRMMGDCKAALSSGGGKPGQGYPAILFTSDGENADPIGAHEQKMYTNEGAHNFKMHNVVGEPTSMAVRRLTPVECSRL